MVAAVLPTVPAGVSVHTIALGAASDQVLLQHIADATGGSYFFSPDELGLFQIYNVARGALADSDMVADDTVSFPAGDSSYRGLPISASPLTRPTLVWIPICAVYPFQTPISAGLSARPDRAT